jgi:prepilin-type N-terminal cleavage/methylation domain-containing protein
MRRVSAGFTLIELLIGVAIVAVLAAIGIPGYLGFVQRAREVTVIQYLREVHKGQQEWRLETDSAGYTGDFDELEETGFIPDAVNFVRVRLRPPRRGVTRETSSRLVQGYRLDLTARDTGSLDTSTYSVTAYPSDRNQKLRWFYIDQFGMIRGAVGWAGPGAPPI